MATEEELAGSRAHHPPVHLRLFEQLRQRNVFRVAALYGVVCWLILEPVHVIFHMLEVPPWANRLVVILMALGFPAVVIFAWVYEITAEGLKLTEEVSHDQSIRRVTARRLDAAIIAVLSVVLAYFVVDKFWISKRLSASKPLTNITPQAGSTSAPPASGTANSFHPPPHSIAVLPFVNLSGDKEQEYGGMLRLTNTHRSMRNGAILPRRWSGSKRLCAYTTPAWSGSRSTCLLIRFARNDGSSRSSER